MFSAGVDDCRVFLSLWRIVGLSPAPTHLSGPSEHRVPRVHQLSCRAARRGCRWNAYTNRLKCSWRRSEWTGRRRTRRCQRVPACFSRRGSFARVRCARSCARHSVFPNSSSSSARPASGRPHSSRRKFALFLDSHDPDRVLLLLAEGVPDTSFPRSVSEARRLVLPLPSGGEQSIVDWHGPDIRDDENRPSIRKCETENLKLLAPISRMRGAGSRRSSGAQECHPQTHTGAAPQRRGHGIGVPDSCMVPNTFASIGIRRSHFTGARSRCSRLRTWQSARS